MQKLVSEMLNLVIILICALGMKAQHKPARQRVLFLCGYRIKPSDLPTGHTFIKHPERLERLATQTGIGLRQ